MQGTPAKKAPEAACIVGPPLKIRGLAGYFLGFYSILQALQDGATPAGYVTLHKPASHPVPYAMTRAGLCWGSSLCAEGFGEVEGVWFLALGRFYDTGFQVSAALERNDSQRGV